MSTHRLIFSAFAAILVMAGLSGCGTLITSKEDVLAIKKVAVVSLATNADIYNVKSGIVQHGMVDKQAAAMKVLLGKTEDTTQKSLDALLAATSPIYLNAFKEISHWNVMGIEQVKDLPAYQAAAGESVEDPNYLTARIMPGTKYFNPFKPNENPNGPSKTWQDLTALCNALKVDAVMTIMTTLAYEPTGLQLIGGLGGLMGVMKSPGRPYVGTALAVVTKNGKSAVYTLSGNEFTGDEVNLAQSGMVNFTGDDEKIIASYSKAIKTSAAALVKRILTEMTAK